MSDPISNIKRTDSRYTDIDNLEKYEVTSCVVYEMYIRSVGEEHRLNLNGNLIEYEKLKISDIVLYENTTYKFTLQDIIYSVFPQLLEDAKKKVEKEVTKELKNKGEKLTNKKICFLENIKKRRSREHNKLKEKFKEEISQKLSIEIEKLFEKYNKIINEAESSYSLKIKEEERKFNQLKDYKLSHFSFDLDYLISEYVEKIDDKDINFQEVTYKDLITGKYITVTKEFLLSRINEKNILTTVIPSFKRQQVYFKENYFVNIKYLNLSLPNKEIIDFIEKLRKKIKEDTSKINKVIKNLPESYILSDIEYKKLSNKNIPKLLRKPKDAATMLFIYDVVKDYNFKHKKETIPSDFIINQLTQASYIDNDIKSISDKTIRNYYNTAKEYIDKKQYLRLISEQS